MLLQAIVTMLCPLASKYGYVVLVIYVVVFGISDGCWSVMLGMGTELIVGKSTMPRAFGSLFGVISIPLIVGPPVAGKTEERALRVGMVGDACWKLPISPAKKIPELYQSYIQRVP